MSQASGSPRKIAVLGSGIGALTAVVRLTADSNWKSNYDITIYQMGWKLGGKLSNGRNIDENYRDQEHGYHVLFGFYNNAFTMMEEVYEKLNRPDTQPFSKFASPTIQDELDNPEKYVMHRKGQFFIASEFANETKFVELKLPIFDGIPDKNSSPMAELFLRAARILFQLIKDCFGHDRLRSLNTGNAGAQMMGYNNRQPNHLDTARGMDEINQHLDTYSATIDQMTKHLDAHQSGNLSDHFDAFFADPINSSFANIPLDSDAHHSLGILNGLLNFGAKTIARTISGILKVIWDLIEHLVEDSWELKRDWILINLIGTVLIGVAKSKLLRTGFDSINEKNFYVWLQENSPIKGKSTQIMLESSYVKFAYIALLAYIDGDTTSPPTADKPLYGKPNIEAGTVLRFFTRMLLDYKGAATWEFQVNAGDAIVAPIYELLHQRGVKFEFFSQVTNLALSSNNLQITEIEISKQAELAPNQTEYLPLIDVPGKGIKSWPDQPNYSQLDPAQAAYFQQNNVDLSSIWAANKFAKTHSLKAGVDFDDVLLGISAGALGSITPELKRIPAWNQMVGGLHTVRTFAVQTWLNKTIEQLGWTKGGHPIGNTVTNSTPMRADATQVIKYEDWSPDNMPLNRAYHGGPFPDDPAQPPPPMPQYPAEQSEIAKQRSIDFLNTGTHGYWPNASQNGQFRWDWLISMYTVATIEPSDRYVQAATGTGKVRLTTDGTGVENLFLVGDWTKTILNCGCVEAAVMSGLNAAEAILEQPIYIRGRYDRAI